MNDTCTTNYSLIYQMIEILIDTGQRVACLPGTTSESTWLRYGLKAANGSFHSYT